MAVTDVLMCFLNTEQALQGYVAGASNQHLEAACHCCAPLLYDMVNWGMVIKGECLVCRKRLKARFGGKFELAVAVDWETIEAKFLGVVCEKCAKLSSDVKGEALKARFGPTKPH